MELENSFCNEFHAHIDNWVTEVVVNKQSKNFLSDSTAIEKNVPNEMDISYATRNPVIHSTVTVDISAEICQSLDLMVKQTTFVTVWQQQTKRTVLSFAPTDENITYYSATNQKSLLSRSFKTKHGSAPRQHIPFNRSLEIKAALSQESQLIVELSLIKLCSE